MKPWYRVIDAHSPNKLYKVQFLRIHSGVKGLASASVRCVNGKVDRISTYAFRTIRTVDDVEWVVKNQHLLTEWITFLELFKAFETLDELVQWLGQTPLFGDFDKKVHQFERRD